MKECLQGFLGDPVKATFFSISTANSRSLVVINLIPQYSWVAILKTGSSGSAPCFDWWPVLTALYSADLTITPSQSPTCCTLLHSWRHFFCKPSISSVHQYISGLLWWCQDFGVEASRALKIMVIIEVTITLV